MNHRTAVFAMVCVTLLWSIAGVVTRHLDQARSFEVTFWRSAFNALALAVMLHLLRGPALWRSLVRSPWPVWVSGMCWGVMYTAFMVALTLTSVANVLVTMALGPLLTALLARLALGHRLAARTWGAIAVAGGGIAWMFGHEARGSRADELLGTAVALLVPLAAATNWTVLQHIAQRARTQARTSAGEAPLDMLGAVLIGAVLSALVSLPLAWPFQASGRDLSLLALLGVVQLALPCLLVVRVSRVLSAPEVSLLGLLEVIFGVTWAWLGAGEEPSSTTLLGGALVLGALVANEALALRDRSRASLLKETA